MPLQVEIMVTFVVKIAVMIVGYTDNKKSLSNCCLQLIHGETWLFLILSMGIAYTLLVAFILTLLQKN